MVVLFQSRKSSYHKQNGSYHKQNISWYILDDPYNDLIDWYNNPFNLLNDLIILFQILPFSLRFPCKKVNSKEHSIIK